MVSCKPSPNNLPCTEIEVVYLESWSHTLQPLSSIPKMYLLALIWAPQRNRFGGVMGARGGVINGRKWSSRNNNYQHPWSSRNVSSEVSLSWIRPSSISPQSFEKLRDVSDLLLLHNINSSNLSRVAAASAVYWSLCVHIKAGKMESIPKWVKMWTSFATPPSIYELFHSETKFHCHSTWMRSVSSVITGGSFTVSRHEFRLMYV